MQKDNNAGQQQSAGGGNAPPNQMTAAQQAQYRATLLQQQQMQAMQAANRAQQQHQQQQQQQGGRPMASQQQQQQMQQGGQARPPAQSNANPAATQAQMQALQQLFQSNPEQLAAFVSMSREGRFNAEQMNQLRGAVTAAQQAQQLQQQQQGVRPNPPAPQQARPVPTQQQQQVRPNPQQQQQQMQQQQQGQGRPPNNPPDLQALMLQMQKMADPIGRKIKELEATLARPAHQGGLAPNTAERTKVEMEHNEVKQQQAKLMQQFMSVKAQYLAQTGQAQQSQQMQQQLLLQQQRAQQAAASAQAANNGNNNAASLSQAQALANQNRGVGTPPLNIRPSPGPKVRPAPEQQGSRPQTPGVSQGSTGARSSPSGQGQPGRSSTPANNASPHFQQPHIPPEAMTQRSNLISGPSNASGMAGGSNQGPFGAGIPTNLNVQPSVPEPYPNSTGPRPTLNQGLGTNPTLGTPAILQRPDLVSTNAAGGIASGSGAGLSSWEELLGTVAREGKSGANGLTGSEMDAITMDLGNPDFWDALTGKGTGADSLINAGTTSATSGGGAGMTSGDGRLLTKRKVQELVAEIDGNERLEGDVEDLLLEIADEFIDSVTQFACKLAKHRKGDRLEVRDVQLHLERSWNLRIPTSGSTVIPPPRISAPKGKAEADGSKK